MCKFKDKIGEIITKNKTLNHSFLNLKLYSKNCKKMFFFRDLTKMWNLEMLDELFDLEVVFKNIFKWLSIF